MVKRTKELVSNKNWLASKLNSLPMVQKVYPSDANFLLVKFDNARQAYSKLASNGIVVRDRSTQPGCEGCLRITVGTREEVETLLNCLNELNADDADFTDNRR
jgi:histidinol-phosphate/aromatic aminotransferase/cobyric acid decarboxylase-like protein